MAFPARYADPATFAYAELATVPTILDATRDVNADPLPKIYAPVIFPVADTFAAVIAPE